MKNVLIISREFQHPNNACGVCLYNIALEFLKRGCNIYVVSLVSKMGVFQYDSHIHVVELYEDWFTTLCNQANSSSKKVVKTIYRIIQFLRLFLVSVITPDTAPFKTREIYRTAKKIVRECKIDTIVGSYTPYETISAPILLKRWNTTLKVINYHLDPLLVPGNSSRLISLYKYKRAYSAVIKEVSIVDKILVPETFYEIYPNCDNVIPVGFPLYKKNVGKEKLVYNFNSSFINIVYVGTLDSTNRNISYTLRLMDSLASMGLKVKLHIWGSLLDNETQELVGNCRYAEFHGLIDSNLVPSILANADILLNVCNLTHYSSLPSKIFQLFASNKPILVIKRHDKDTSLPYFKIYGNVYFAEEENWSEELLNNLRSFILQRNNDRTDERNSSSFLKYTPEYICDQINI